MEIHTLQATPETDAALKMHYGLMGEAAFKAGEPRACPCDPSSMVGGWWFAGWDAAAS